MFSVFPLDEAKGFLRLNENRKHIFAADARCDVEGVENVFIYDDNGNILCMFWQI